MWVSHKIQVTCLNCGKKFKVKPSEKAKGRGKFCSKKCYGEWQSRNAPRGEKNPRYKRVTIICKMCGREFKAPPSANRKYCSRECYVKSQPRKFDWEKLRGNLRELYVEKKLSTIQIAKRFNCDSKTLTYWMDKFGIPRRSPSEIMKINNPAKRSDVRKKMSEAQKRRSQRSEEKKGRSERAKKLWADPVVRENLRRKISQSLIGNKRRKGKPHPKEIRRKIGESIKTLWRNTEYARKVVTALQSKPNECERKLIKLIEENHFPFKYVGDGQVVIDGQVPDFIATDGSRKVIELFGTPWHDPNHSEKIQIKPSRTENAKRKFYESHGYDCLILWDDELNDEDGVLEKIKMFIQ